MDTNTGELLAVENLILGATVSGCVTGMATSFGDPPTVPPAADSDNNQPILMQIPGVQVSAIGVEQTYTGSDGCYELTGLLEGVEVTIETRLIGQWVTVETDLGEELVLSQQATPGQTGVDFVYNADPEPVEYGTAQVNAFLCVEKTHDFFKELQPSATVIDQNLPCLVNDDGPCGANYGAHPPKITFTRATLSGEDQCRNGAFSTAITHEYGHFIVRQLLGNAPSEDLKKSRRAFGEGAADTLAALVWNTQKIGLDYWCDGLAL